MNGAGGLGLGFVITAKDMATSVMRGVGREVDGMAKHAANSGDAMKSAGDELKSMGQKMTVAGMAGGAALGYAASEAAEYGKKVGLVQTIADSAQFPLKKIQEIGYDMAGTYGGDAGTQVAALYNALSSGASTAADATALMNEANKLAVSGSTTVDSAMGGLTGTVNAFGMQMTEASKVSDAFFTAVKLGAADMSVDVLAKQFSGVSATAHTLGVSLDDTLAGLAKLTASGTPTSQAVTELKAVLTSIMQPSADAAAEAKRLGIAFDMAGLKSKGLQGLLDSIQASGKMTPDTMKKLFGSSVEAFGGISKLYGDGGTQFRDFASQMHNASGAANTAFGIMSSKSAFAAGQLKANLGVALLRIGDIIAPVFGAIGAAINIVVLAFNKAPAPLQKMLVYGAAAASALLVLTGAALTLAGTIMGLAAVGTAAAAAFGVVIGVSEVMTVAIAFAGATIATFTAAAEANVGGFGSFVKDAFAKASLAVSALSDLFSTGQMSGAVAKELYKTENDGLWQFVKQLYLWGARIGNFFANIGAGVSEGLSGMTEPFEELKGALMGLAEAFGVVPESAEESTNSFVEFGAAGRNVASIVVSGIKLLVGGFTTLANFATGVVTGFRNVWATAGQVAPVFDTLSQVVSMVGTAFAAFTGGTTAASSGAQGLGTTMGSVLGGIAMVFGIFVNAIATGFSFMVGVVGAFGSLFQGIAGIVSGVVNVVGGVLSGNWAQAWMGAKQIVAGAVQGIIGALMSIIGAVLGIVDGIGRMLGKDLGLQKGIEAQKGAMNKSVSEGLGLDQPQNVIPLKPPPPNGPQPVQTTPGALPTPATPPGVTAPGGGAGPGTVAAAATPGAGDIAAAMAAASKPAAAPPVNVNTAITLQVDGAVLAETVDKYSTANGGRANGAAPAAK